MNKKKGFTLVELLAVVVVLGIISVISVPVVKNITKDAKEKGLQKQIDVILESAKNWAVQNTDLLPEDNGSILVKVDTLKKEGLLENKKIINPVNNKEMNKCAKISYNENYNQYEYEYTECHALNGIINSTSNECATKGICTFSQISEGVKLNIQVNAKQNYDFYVINDDGNKLTLIMDRNIGDTIAWVNQEDYNDDTNYGEWGNNNKGPITVLNYLNSQTANWNNIDPIESYTYDNNLNGTTYDYGYQKLEIKDGVGKLTSQDGATITELEGISRARLLTLEEVKTLETNNNGEMPTYLYDNLGFWVDGYWKSDYWLLTADPSIDSIALGMDYYSYLINNDVLYGEGVRPVIEILKHATIY